MTEVPVAFDVSMLYDPVSLIRDDRCPVFKKRSFFVEYQYYFNQTAGQPGMELLGICAGIPITTPI